MLKTRFMKLLTTKLGEGRFLLTAEDERGHVMSPSRWKNLVFSSHEESFFGTLLETETVNDVEGVVVSGWHLVSLFAKESFNRYIEWDWNEQSEICLAAAHSLYEGIVEKDWLPDFSVWEHGDFRWKLPERVKDEFDPSFWEQRIEEPEQAVDELIGHELGTTKNYISALYNDALDGYLTRNSAMKELFGPKLDLLRKQNISGGELARYFDEESWLEWVGIKESDTPFTIGLRLDEPVDGEGAWSLDLFIRGKKNVDEVYDVDGTTKIPAKWRPFLEKVDRERDRWVRLIPWLGEDGYFKTHLSEEEAWMFLTEASETLVALDVEILLPSWWQAMKNANLKVKASLKGGSSHRPSFVGLQAMLDFNWRFSMNGVDLSEDEFGKLVEEKRRLVFIRGRWVKLDPQFIRQIQDMMKRAEKEGLHVRDLLEQELLESDATEDELDNPKAFAKIQIELNRQWKQMIKQLAEVHEIPLEDVPSGLQGELRPYQQLGMSWLWFLRQYGFGACLADDMGLGKTVQLISYLLKVKDVVGDELAVVPDTQTEAKKRRKKDEDASAVKVPTKAALIICPTSVLGNWQKELERFAPEMKVYLHYGSNRLKEEAFAEKAKDADIVLTSYGLSHIDLAEFESLIWSSIAIDEAQNIKNAQTKQSKAVRRLRGRHHIALTGTPMENRLSELWSIFDFTNHGYLGSLGQFQKKFVIPIEKDEKKDKVQQLQALIRPFLLRRTKKDEEVALNLPDKLEQKEYCPLTAEQASLYEQLIHDTFAEIEKLTGFERKGLILQMLSRLKQLCNHPALYLKEKSAGRELLERSNKLEKLVELIDAVLEQGESCLIFTQYIEMGEMIRSTLKKKFGIEVPFLNGSVPKVKRDEMIERFQNQEFPVFLLSLKAGGTGLNLTAANHVIHYDRWWNPAVENQATDRAYRIGQSRFVHVHKMICTGTLEEKIDAMLEKKQFLNDQIIQSENWITELSTDELKDLVYLG
ncbi:Superfamily II DNA or RNA helicase, SNF2 family [Bacillus sp. OV166]|uniref:DEAD/DEAH box helicase n=1 Tax=unclassified Bacillus (in: firmicutes) TaxID=185979 RepID=UPI000A2ACD8A|nr:MULTISPECIES: DEAD/DEAH box helicase [unclassified Bacillus (in: firmicutes)]PGY12604.1 ATP-dependent helicase [Bacillus sp. AFS031507]SMQ85145.1 Superfamily II DNA or RNA helicase, SNF2 family [Bacillus sp. OV166]